MPKMKNGELILTPKEQNFYKYLLADPKQNATAAAIQAGYSAKTAANAGSKLKRSFYKGHPPEAWKATLLTAGWDYHRVIGLLNRVEQEGGAKDLLQLARIMLASHGVSVSETAVQQAVTVQGPGPVMIVMGDKPSLEREINLILKEKQPGEELTEADKRLAKQRYKEEVDGFNQHVAEEQASGNSMKIICADKKHRELKRKLMLGIPPEAEGEVVEARD